MTFPIKACCCCRKSKPLNAFYKSDKGVKGRSAWCIRCHAAVTARRLRQYEASANGGVVPAWMFVTSVLFNVCLVVAYAVVVMVRQ